MQLFKICLKTCFPRFSDGKTLPNFLVIFVFFIDCHYDFFEPNNVLRGVFKIYIFTRKFYNLYNKVNYPLQIIATCHVSWVELCPHKKLC